LRWINFSLISSPLRGEDKGGGENKNENFLITSEGRGEIYGKMFLVYCLWFLDPENISLLY